jgi:nucleoside-diphosphate-sugar epimerase
LLLKLGMAGTIKLKDKKRRSYTVFILTDKKKDFLTPEYPKRDIERYDGYVYCVNVPNHIIYIRRNGKSLWCGNCYDEAKRFAEAMAMAYHYYHKIDTKIVRIFNTYGPRMRKDDGRVVPTFITQALEAKPLTVFGDGTQTRSFCYVSDMVQGIYKLLLSDINEPINLGNPQEMTINDFAKLLLKLTRSKSKIIHKPLPVDDPKIRQPDITRAKKLLKWSPKVSLEEGLQKTIEYFKKIM